MRMGSVNLLVSLVVLTVVWLAAAAVTRGATDRSKPSLKDNFHLQKRLPLGVTTSEDHNKAVSSRGLDEDAEVDDFEEEEVEEGTGVDMVDEHSVLPRDYGRNRHKGGSLLVKRDIKSLLADCSYTLYGCCPDGYAAAHGNNMEGCCLVSVYGCCLDHITEAIGPYLEGCTCENSPYGCCPDNQTAVTDPNNHGCDCRYTQYGCCPDHRTIAAGNNYRGCPCNTFPHGCCTDGLTVAQGPNAEGCGCAYEPYGCCGDQRTPATGPGEGEGCGCEASMFGCCPDGVTPASGNLFDGCPEEEEEESSFVPGEVCGHDKDRGPCSNFRVKWFFDIDYAACTRFWYGGCGGNLNKFETEEQCQSVCVSPEGMEVCHLPRVEGPCTGVVESWYHDTESGSCQSFTYGGCLGNNNRFTTQDQCQNSCVLPQVTDVCLLEKVPGPCGGYYPRWHYNQATSACLLFYYSGCRGNGNNFLTENECLHRCVRSRSKVICTLPKSSGGCEEMLPRWYYGYSEGCCIPFYYTGCDGNANRFHTRGECESVCPGDVKEFECSQPRAPGDCNRFEERFYFNAAEGHCRTFEYSGCGGNNNNFQSLAQCESYCGNQEELNPNQFSQESCFLESNYGTCDGYLSFWYYNSSDGVCKLFLYSGCDGNNNRFQSVQECEEKCGEVVDICALPLVVGPCSDSFRKYYYDAAANECYEFDYGGCLGNKNRFDSEQMCQQRCLRILTLSTTTIPDTTSAITTSTSTTTTPSPDTTTTMSPENSEANNSNPEKFCFLESNYGTCDGYLSFWFYDSSDGVCKRFLYSGCDGNENRFQSLQECEDKCGEVVDICTLPLVVGPCSGSFRQYYYSAAANECYEFSYGGCLGNKNRFDSKQMCQQRCQNILTLPSTMIPDTTSTTTSTPKTTTTTMTTTTTTTTTPSPDPTTTTTIITMNPETSDSNPKKICFLTHDYGTCHGYRIYWYFDASDGTCKNFFYSGCGGNANSFPTLQECKHKCEDAVDTCTLPLMEGPCSGSFRQYYFDAAANECYEFVYSGCQGNKNRFDSEQECRQQCKSSPTLTPTTTTTTTTTTNPTTTTSINPTTTTIRTTTTTPSPNIDNTNTTPEGPDEPPRIHQFEDDVSSEENDVVELTCEAYGNPTPAIKWYQGQYQLDMESRSSRFRVLPSGSLQIINTEKGDAGTYTCEAANGIGNPDRQTTILSITDPRPREAKVIPWSSPEYVTSLGKSTFIFCRAVGWPRPIMTWRRENGRVPVSSNKYEQFRNGSLMIRKVALENLGPYSCMAYNSEGRGTKQTIVLKAYGPVSNTLPRDRKFLQYIVDPTTSTNPPDVTHPFPTITPDQHPNWPEDHPASIDQPPATTTTTVPPTTLGLLTTLITLNTATHIVPVSAEIPLTTSIFSSQSTIRILCAVRGYPPPLVNWFKDIQPIYPASEKYQIQEDHTLVIKNAKVEDSGSYMCEVRNVYGLDYSSATISIIDTQSPP